MLQRSLECQKYFLSYWQYALKVYPASYIKINVLVSSAHVQVLIKPHSYKRQSQYQISDYSLSTS